MSSECLDSQYSNGRINCPCGTNDVLPGGKRCSPCGCLNGVCNVNGRAECCPCGQGECRPAVGGNLMCCEDCHYRTTDVVPGGKRCSPYHCLKGVCNHEGRAVCCPCQQENCRPAAGGNYLCCEDCPCGTNTVVNGQKRCSPCNCGCDVCNNNNHAVCCGCSPSCFPSRATVFLENGKSVRMSELKTGDKVQTGKYVSNYYYLMTQPSCVYYCRYLFICNIITICIQFHKVAMLNTVKSGHF